MPQLPHLIQTNVIICLCFMTNTKRHLWKTHQGNLQNALWLLSLSSPDTWDRVTKAGSCDTRAAGSRSFTTIYISLVISTGFVSPGFLTQRSKGRSDNSDVDHLAWRSRAIYPIRSTNTPMSRRSEKIISNWLEVCKGIHIIGIFCSHKQARPEVRHGLLRAGCFFWHIVFYYYFLWPFHWNVMFIWDANDELFGHQKFLTYVRILHQTWNLPKKIRQLHFLSQTNYATSAF